MFNFQLKDIIGTKKEQHKFGVDKDSDLNYLLKECKTHLKSYNEAKIKKAFHMCYSAHNNKLRKSGEPSYTHPLQVSLILIEEIQLDDISVIAALLHEVMDTGQKFSKNDITEEFGTDVARIVHGIHKIEHIETRELTPIDQLENYRKLLLSLFQDFRIIIVKLADRLHNMRTIDYLSENGQQKLAKETLDVYAPFANRFGLRNIKWELEDLSFKVLNRTAYDEIKANLNSTREEREDSVKKLIDPIKEKLDKDPFVRKNKIKYKIYGRAKHIYSIYNKMRIRQKRIDELYDLIALRVILETNDPYFCFYVYGLIASLYPPVPETFKDYINSPKKNGYQSIHTGVIGLKNRPIEIQIRTLQMHEQSEKGVAAHFRYKSGKVENGSVLENEQISQWIAEVREIFENAEDENSELLLENVKKNIFMDEIYVFTPKNEFRSLPKDSTPIDFAFSIHSDIGYRYIGAKVNSKIVPANYKLQSGDQVEILTSNHSEPDPEWLTIAITAKAKSAISKFLRDKEREFIEKGKEIWKDSLKSNGILLKNSDEEKIIKSFNLQNEDDFYKNIYNKEINISKVLDFIKYKLREVHENPTSNLMNVNKQRVSPSNSNGKYFKPIIFEKNGKWITEMKIVGKDRPNMLSDITKEVISLGEINILGISINTFDATFEGIISLDSDKKDSLEKLFKKIKSVRGVETVDSIQK